MSQELRLKINGLYTHPSELAGIPEGALSVADDIVIDEENVAAPRRGYERSFALPSGSDRANKLTTYQEKVIAHYASTSLGYYDGSSFTAYSGTYTPISGVPVRFAEANQNLYFTTATGVKKLDVYNGTPGASGSPRALNTTAALSSAGTPAALENNKSVAYRVVWGIEDVNQNLILGAPSERVVISNTAGATRDVTLTITIPSSITASYFFQVYRSAAVSTATTPTDELGLVYEAYPTAAEISALSLSFTDSTPDSLRGATLYASPSQEGILQANDEPPRAKDITVNNTFTFYANTVSKHRATFTILAADGGGAPGSALQVNDVIQIAGIKYTGKATETVANAEFAVSTAASAASRIQETAQSLVKVINQHTSNTLVYAYYLSGPNDLPGKILIEERSLGGSEFAAIFKPVVSTANPFAPQLGKTQSITSVDTGTDTLTVTAHGYSNNDRVNFATTGSLSGGLSAATVYYVVSATTNTFQVSLTKGGSAVDITSSGSSSFVAEALVLSANDTFKNGLYFSKSGQPEAVPTSNVFRVGSADAEIQRILPLRGSLFILKEDGIFRLTGESASSFRVDLFDNTAKLLAPETAVVHNNQIIGMSDQGVIAITETGLTTISRPIEVSLLDLLGASQSGVESYSFGISYETDRKYILFTISSASDTTATQAFVFNGFTSTWTRWTVNAKCGYVNSASNKIFIGDDDSEYVLSERKALSFRDFADFGKLVTISAVSGISVTVDDASSIEQGDILYQSDSIFALIESVNTVTKVLTTYTQASFTTGSRQILKAIPCALQWVPMTGGNPGVMKHFREVTLLFKKEISVEAELTFSTDISNSGEAVTITTDTVSVAWGTFAWGQSPWGGVAQKKGIRTFIPLEKQRANQMNIKFSHAIGYSQFKLNGISVIFNPASERTTR